MEDDSTPHFRVPRNQVRRCGGGWRFYHFPHKFYSPISWARPLRPRILKSACARPHSILSGIRMSASGSAAWASAVTPQCSAATSKLNPKVSKSPLQTGHHHLASPRKPKLGARPQHQPRTHGLLCKLTRSRRGIRGRRGSSKVPGRLASAPSLTGSPGSGMP